MDISIKQIIEVEKNGVKMNLTTEDICAIVEEVIIQNNTIVCNMDDSDMQIRLNHVNMNGQAIQFNLMYE